MQVWRKALMFVLVAALLAWADSFVRIVRISDVSGAVQVSRPEPGQTALHRWTAATLNAPIVEDEAVRTLTGGKAEIQLECGSALRLTPDSQFSFPRLRLRSDGTHWTQVAMHSGTAFFVVQKADAREFQVEVAGSEIATPDGAADFRVDAPAEAAVKIRLLNGHARVHVAGTWLALSKAATLELRPRGSSIFVANAAQDQWTRWSHERDQAYQRARMANQPQPAVNGAQSAPPAVPTAIVPQVNLDNPGEVFKEIDSGALSSDPFFANKSNPLRVPNCHNN